MELYNKTDYFLRGVHVLLGVRHPSVQDQGELPEAVTIGKDHVFVVSGFLARDPADLDLIVHGREQDLCVHS